IVELTSRYDYAADHEARQAGRRARARGYYTKSEFMAVCGWKSIRSSGLAKANSESIIHSRTRIALAVDNDRGRMRELTKLNGVGVPVASTLLHFAFPRRYPILDYRVLESLGKRPQPAVLDQVLALLRRRLPAHRS